MITNRNRIQGISRDGKQAIDSEAIKLFVTESVNPVSSSESKRTYHGRSPRREPKEKSAATIVVMKRAPLNRRGLMQ